VENAIKHGVSRSTDKGRIRISSTRDQNRLRLTVVDNGPGIASGDGIPGTGVGISNLRARLLQLFGEDHTFAITSSSEGVTVVLEIPFRMAREGEQHEETP
jgi:LytS/YehU family sensor histidine kinase